MPPGWVCLDVGEVLVDETRVWHTWAETLEVPPFTLQAVLGGCLALGGDHREAFARLGRPDWTAHAAAVEAALGPLTDADLYADARGTLDALRTAGWRVAVCGNQPARRAQELRDLGLTAEVITTSAHLEAEKPDPAFFARLLQALTEVDAAARPEHVVYVGDRVDNDVVAAAAAGLHPVWLRRGPWGLLGHDIGGRAALTLGALAELPDALAWLDADLPRSRGAHR